MLIRRRPVLRAAAVGTIGYASYRAGKSAASSQQQTPTPTQATPAPQITPAAPAAPATAAPAPASQTERIKALTDLKSLLDSGAITQAEFDQAKKDLLAGG
jgi:hypothetical protein